MSSILPVSIGGSSGALGNVGTPKPSSPVAQSEATLGRGVPGPIGCGPSMFTLVQSIPKKFARSLSQGLYG